MNIKKIKNRVAQRKMITKRMGLLTKRQLCVLKMTGEGYRSMEIAKTLKVSDKTIDAHKCRIIAKLKLKGRAELRRVAFKHSVQCLLKNA